MEFCFAAWNDTHEPHRQNTEPKKADAEGYVLYDSIYVRFSVDRSHSSGYGGGGAVVPQEEA